MNPIMVIRNPSKNHLEVSLYIIRYRVGMEESLRGGKSRWRKDCIMRETCIHKNALVRYTVQYNPQIS